MVNSRCVKHGLNFTAPLRLALIPARTRLIGRAFFVVFRRRIAAPTRHALRRRLGCGFAGENGAARFGFTRRRRLTFDLVNARFVPRHRATMRALDRMGRARKPLIAATQTRRLLARCNRRGGGIGRRFVRFFHDGFNLNYTRQWHFSKKRARRFRRVAAFDRGAVRRGQRVGRGAIGAPGRRVGGLVPPTSRAEERIARRSLPVHGGALSGGSSARRETGTRACRNLRAPDDPRAPLRCVEIATEFRAAQCGRRGATPTGLGRSLAATGFAHRAAR